MITALLLLLSTIFPGLLASPLTRQEPCPSNSKLRRENNNRATLIITYNSASDTHTGVVNIGGQNLKLLPDTGSGDSWVFSTSLPPSDQARHSVYNPALSPTFKDLGEPFSSKYGDQGWVTGIWGSDNIEVAGIEAAIEVQQQHFGVSHAISPSWAKDTADGLLGLSFSYNREHPGFFENVYKALDSPIFGIHMPFLSDGEIHFGFTDSSKYTGEIAWASVSFSKTSWSFRSESYKIGGRTFAAPGIRGTVDTGANAIFLQIWQSAAYWYNVPEAKYDPVIQKYRFPCETILPDLSVKVGSTNYATIPGEFIKKNHTEWTLLRGSPTQIPMNNNVNVYGYPFLAANYGVHDLKNSKFGFAPLVVSS